MSDSDLPSASSPGTPLRASELEQVRAAGRWMPWAAFCIAVLWWGCVAAALVTTIDVSVVLSQPPITLAAGGVMALLPGLLILMAGFMARESARGALANAMVLRAAGQLLQPADAVAGQAETLARRLSGTAREVDQSMGEALGAMKALSSEIGDERLRLESVSYAAADNARDLSSQLAAERTALESLVRELRSQGETLNEAIPRQAQHMVEAARVAAEEIGRADEALDNRLSAMRAASQSLGSELARLNQMAGEAGSQSETLMHAIARVEDKLDHSKRTVDSAIRASEAAVAAAGSTGEALQAAVSSALDDARRASLEIQKRTRESSEDAAMQIQVLRQSAEQASSALRSVRDAAMVERELAAHPASEAPRPAERPDGWGAPTHGVTRAPDPARPAPNGDAGGELFASPPRHAPSSPQRNMDSELFDTPPQDNPSPNGASEPGLPRLRLTTTSSETAWALQDQTAAPARREAPPPFDPLEDTAPEREPNAIDSPKPKDTPVDREAGWSTILNDIDRTDTGEMSRETTAETVIRRLEAAGMTLSNIFRPKDKRRIAGAARKGESQRRNATRSVAGFELDRIADRLMGDATFLELAREFVAMETADAMAALDRTQKSARNASPRLSAFLLLDAALGD